MNEVMAAVDAYARSPHRQGSAYLDEVALQQARKAVEQAVALLMLRELEQIDGAPAYKNALVTQRISYWRVLAGEQEPARSDGGM